MKLFQILILAVFAFSFATSTQFKCGIATEVCRYLENGDLNPASLIKYQAGLVCQSKHRIKTVTIQGVGYACCTPRHHETGNKFMLFLAIAAQIMADVNLQEIIWLMLFKKIEILN